jgi:RNA polymerase sigma-70 factor (ECF subfamily)
MTERLTANDLPRIYGEHAGMVLRRAQRLLGSASDAEDAMQEIFVRAFRSLDAFDGRSSVSTWLYSITTHYCLNLLRDQGRRRALEEENLQPGDAPSLVQPAQRVLLRHLLAIAEPELAEVVVCIYLEGMSQQEAAEVLGVAQRTVGNRLNRFLELARQHAASSAFVPSPAGGSIDQLPRRSR